MNDGRTVGRPDGHTVDILAIAAHRDDVELTCGGTLAKAARAGHRVGILDLTQGESGTRGDAATRASEAERATRALGAHVRLNAELPDAHLATDVARDACYLAGLVKYGPRPGVAPHRPFKLLYALAYREDPVKPSFVVDISATFDAKMAAVRCYASQFDGAKAAG